MNCLECHRELSYMDHKCAMELFGVELCIKHLTRMKLLVRKCHTPIEAIQLYYALKAAGVYTMLNWWNGIRTVDLAIARVKLNIEIDSDYQRLTAEQAVNKLEAFMCSVKDGFTTIRIPDVLVRNHRKELVSDILAVIGSLKIKPTTH